MEPIWKRKYNIKNRLYIEGLYLNKAGFNTDKNISYEINSRNNCVIIQLSKSSDNKITHNISRSGKVVPTIGVRNKSIESFINSHNDMELLVFKGVIVLFSKDKTNKNIALCEALILKNEDIKNGVKRIFKTLMYMGILEDSDLISEIDKSCKNESYCFKHLPRKIISKYKLKLRKDIKNNKKLKTKSLVKLSNSYVISLIIKEDILYEDDVEEELCLSNDLLNFVSLNYISFKKVNDDIYSYTKKSRYLNDIIREFENRKSLRILASIQIYLKFSISYINILMLIAFQYIEKSYLSNRKKVKTLSPPFYLNA